MKKLTIAIIIFLFFFLAVTYQNMSKIIKLDKKIQEIEKFVKSFEKEIGQTLADNTTYWNEDNPIPWIIENGIGWGKAMSLENAEW